MSYLANILSFILKLFITLDFYTIKLKQNGTGYVVDNYIFLKVDCNKDGSIRCKCKGAKEKCSAKGTIKNGKFEALIFE